MGRIWAVLTALLLSYAGYDQYEKNQGSVVVNVEAAEAQPEILNREQVKALIGEAIAANNKQLANTYKKLESWEK